MITSTWLRNWKRSLERRWALHQALRRKPMSRRLATHPRLEALEDRFLLTAYVVTSTADDGSVGNLRDAIKQVDAGTYNEIDFRIGTPGSAQTINITSQLPVVNAPKGVFINGISTMGGNTQNSITLNGSGAGSGVDDLILEGTGCTVSGLVLSNFSRHGINVFSGSNDSIGGTATGTRNVLSGNSGDGVFIAQGVSKITVQGNYIGADATGNAALAHSIGIADYGSNNTIGGAAVGAGNIISGNSLNGVEIRFNSGNLVLGNTIGADAAGNAALGNKGNGIFVDSSNNSIGGTTSGAGNVISGNGQNGVWLFNSGSVTQMPFNYIGANKDGSAALGNGDSGVLVDGNNNTIGGTASAAGNVISGNAFTGVYIRNGTGTLVLGNRIGTTADGAAALPNGIGIEVSAINNTIGSTVSGGGNLVSGNLSNGVQLDSGFNGNKVWNNSIGVNVTGAALGNGAYGVSIASSNNSIGVLGAGNTIANNKSGGVLVSGGSGNTIRFDTIFANGSTSTGPGITLTNGGNNNLAAPTLNTATVSNGILTVTGSYQGIAGVNCYLDFYANPTGLS